MSALRAWVEGMLHRGSGSTTVPILDGALKPNTLLEDAEVLATFEDASDMAPFEGGLLVADGRTLHHRTSSGSQRLRVFDQTITAVAAAGPGGYAVALDGRRVEAHGGALDGMVWSEAGGTPFRSVNALAWQAGRLLATDGSTAHGAGEWARDLMEKGRTGRLVALGRRGVDLVRSGMAYAGGVCGVGDEVWISESWRHRVLRSAGSAASTVLDRLPGYPGRIAPASGGGAWLCLFARRTQLVEFVLQEDAYRRRMMDTIEPRYWIAPALRSGDSILEPRQAGGIKHMGVLKPWAPPRSYGLVVRLGVDGLPRLSAHSRVGGVNHGIVAAVEQDGFLYGLSAGSGRLLRMPVEAIEREGLR